MELWWSEGRRDYQNVASKASRYLLCTDASKCQDPYVLVQRLGSVMIGDSGWTPGDDNHTTMGSCRYALPSTPNDDLAYRDNSYWRGRVWGPLNYLVYMGLSHPKYASEPEIAAARRQLAVQSRQALMVEWLPKHHVHENLPRRRARRRRGQLQPDVPLGGTPRLHRDRGERSLLRLREISRAWSGLCLGRRAARALF